MLVKLLPLFLFCWQSANPSDEICTAEEEVLRGIKSEDQPKSIDDFIMSAENAEESFQGKVMKVELYGTSLFIKATPKNRTFMSVPVQLYAEREIEAYTILQGMRGIVEFQDCIRSPKNLVIILQDGGLNLYSESSPFRASYEKSIRGLIQILRILVRLHKINLAHYNIKPDNIVYDNQREEFSIIGLGMICVIGDKAPYINPQWAAPEYDRYARTHKCQASNDIWHFFLLAFHVLSLHKHHNFVSKLPRNCWRKVYDKNCVRNLHYLLSNHGQHIGGNVMAYILRGLSFRVEDRPNTIEEVRDQFYDFYYKLNIDTYYKRRMKEEQEALDHTDPTVYFNHHKRHRSNTRHPSQDQVNRLRLPSSNEEISTSSKNFEDYVFN